MLGGVRVSQSSSSAVSAPAGVGPGSRIAGYLLQEQIGQGGMAVVYRAHDERLDRTVALKILAPTLAADDSFRQRFIRESRAAAAVDDPHIIPVFEAGEASGVLFIAMRFVHGGDVRTLVTEHGKLPAGRAADIISQVASALDAAHRRGLVHRDVKPANMLLDAGGAAGDRPDHVYLSDFGLSKASLHATGLTGTGTFLGTLDYVSPEQIEGKPVDGRADEYSLACAAFELLSGVPPFRRDQAMAVMYAQLHQPPACVSSVNPELPAGADAVFARALAKVPADRYGSCREFSAALRMALGVPASDLMPGISEPPGPRRPVTEVAPAVPAAAAAGVPIGGQSAPAAEGGELATMAAVRLSAPTVNPAGPRPAEAGAPPGGRHPPPPHGQSRRQTAGLLIVGACILAAAGIVAAAIIARPQRPATAASGAGSTTPSQATSGSASPGAKAQGTPRAQLPQTAGFQYDATLNPGDPAGSISSVAWSPNAQLVAASDKDGSTYLWNAATASRDGAALIGPASAYTTAFSPDGAILATGYRDGSTYLWNVATGRRVAVLRDPGSGSGKEVDSVAFSPDGTRLATGDGNGYANVWDVTDPRHPARRASLADPAGAGIFSVVFSSHGTMATGDYQGHVYLWNSARRVPSATFSLAGGACPAGTICDAVSALAFSADGRLVAAGTERGTAEIWSSATRQGSHIGTFGGHPAIWGLSFGGSGRQGIMLGMASGDGTTYLWRINAASLSATSAGTLPDPGSGSQGVGTLAFSGNGQYLVTGDTNGSAYLWKAR